MPSRPTERVTEYRHDFADLLPAMNDNELKLTILVLFGFSLTAIVPSWHKPISLTSIEGFYQRLLKRLNGGTAYNFRPDAYSLSTESEQFDRQYGEQADLTADSTAPSWVWELSDTDLDLYMEGQLTDLGQYTSTVRPKTAKCGNCRQVKPLTEEFWIKSAMAARSGGFRTSRCKVCLYGPSNRESVPLDEREAVVATATR